MDELKSIVTEMNTLWGQMKSEIEKNKKEGKSSNESLEKMEKRMTELEEKSQVIEAKVNRPPEAGDNTDSKSKAETAKKKGIYFKGLAMQAKNNSLNALSPEESKVMQLSDENSAGFLAPAEYWQDILVNFVEISPIRQFASVRTITSRELVRPKKIQATTAVRRGKETALVDPSDLKYNLVKYQAHPLDALCVLSRDSLEDVGVLEQELTADFSEQFALTESQEFLTGTGVNEPMGILTDSEVEVITSDITNKIDFDDILNLQHSLKEYYWRNARFFANRLIIKHIRKLKDANGQYLWSPPIDASNPATIAGSPYSMTPGMSSTVATTNKVLMFGDLGRAYLIVDRNTMTIEVIREKYLPNIGFYATVRNGGGLAITEAVKVLKVK